MQKQSQFKPSKKNRLASLAWLLILIVGASLACTLGVDSSQTMRVRKTLPTVTATPGAVAIIEPPADAPVAAPVTASESEPVIVEPPTPIATAPVAANNSRQSGAFFAPPPTAIPQQNPLPATNPALAPANTPPASPTPATSPTAARVQPGATPASPLPAPPEPSPTPKSEIPGWTFVNVRSMINQGDAFVVGEAINNTGVPQREVDISGIFYSSKDRLIGDEIEAVDYIPVDVVPIGARVPFELVAESSQPIYRLDLIGLSEPTDNPPRQDFEFLNVKERLTTAGMYCLRGTVKNPGAALNEYLIILLTAYNGQSQVIGFGEHSEISPAKVIANQTAPFDVCLDPLGQPVARYELRAWGW